MADNNADKLKALEDRLGDAEASVESLKNEISATRQSMEEAKNFVNENLPLAISAVNDARAHRESAGVEAKEAHDAAEQAKQTLSELESSADEMLSEGGLYDQAKSGLAALGEQKSKQEQDFDALVEKINGLLPGAASIGLAKAYQDQKKSYIAGTLFWPLVFIVAVGIIVAIGAISIAEFSTSQTVGEATAKLITRLPYYLAAVWLAAFASKRQSQNKRLQQEYAHKETMALSFQGYKNEIDEMDDAELKKKLMDSVVEMVKFNPSDTLDGKHGDDSSPFGTFMNNLFGKKTPSSDQ